MSAASAVVENEDVAALASATGVDLVLSQARAAATAVTPIDRMRVHADVLRAGTGASVLSDGTCGMQMSLERYVLHCRRSSLPHDPAEVLVLREVVRGPAPERPSPLDLELTPGRAVRERVRARRERARQALLRDPEVRARTAGIGGESKRDDEGD